MTISGLVNDGVLVTASLPPANWRELNHDEAPLTLPLIAENYPAKTAVMWNAAYKKFGLPEHNCMVVADPKKVGEILQALRQDTRYLGGGAGVGFKEAVVPHLDELLPIAKAMGAVNIIKKTTRWGFLTSTLAALGMQPYRLVGSNTDGTGYVKSLEDLFEDQGLAFSDAHILILGAGGSGIAIAFALAAKVKQITILNRTESKAMQLANAVNEFVGREVAVGGGREKIPEVISSQDAVISVVDDAHSPLDEYAPLGEMAQPVTPDSIKRNIEQTVDLFRHAKQTLIVSDIRIRSKETPMLGVARELGLPTLNGIPMVINQGIEAFWWIHGSELQRRGVTLTDLASVMRQAASQ